MITSSVKDNSVHVRISGSMTAPNAAALKEGMRNTLQSGHDLYLDLREVDEMDTAGFQLLVMLRTEALEKNIEFRITEHSAASNATIQIFRAEDALA